MDDIKVNIRNGIIVIAVITFFVVGTLVAINIANGRMLNEEGEIVDTSIIRINSSPTDLTAYINGEEVKLIDNRIENLEPGEVLLRLEKEGYGSWEKTVLVETGIVRDVFVRLYPEELDFEQITNVNVDEIFFSENTDFVFYTVLNSDIQEEVGLWRLKLSRNLLGIGENTPSKISSFDSTTLDFLKENEYNINIANDNNRLVLTVPSEEIVRIYDANNNSEFIDLQNDLSYYPDHLTWFRNSDSIIVQEDNLIFEFEIASRQTNLIHYFGENEIVYGVDSDSVYFYRKDQELIYRYINKNSESIELPRAFEIPTSITDIHASDSNSETLIIDTPENKYFIDIENDFISNFGADSEIISISNSNQSIIYIKDNTYNVYVLEDTFNNKSYNTFKKEVSIDNIESIYYTPDGGNIISIVTRGEDKNLWLSDFDGENPKEIISEQSVLSMSSQTSNDGNNLYVLLEDSLDSEDTENSRKNIYKVSLESNQ